MGFGKSLADFQLKGERMRLTRQSQALIGVAMMLIGIGIIGLIRILL